METDRKKEESTLNKRYFYKLGSNIISIFAGIFTSAIVPRALGVNAYGDFSFTNNIVTQFLSFLDMRASTCFYVKLSQRQSESRIVTFYAIYTLLVFAFLSCILIALTLPSTRQFLFEGIDSRIVWFSFLFVGAKWIADILIKISDAYGTTQVVERIKMINYLLSTVLLFVLFHFDVIDINIFYIHQIISFSLLIFFIYRFFKQNHFSLPLAPWMEKEAFKNYAKEFITYSLPLALYLAMALVTEIFDRYILQHYGGSYQQGLYGFSFSMSSMVVLFVTAMVPLFTRELSIAFSRDDVSGASDLYRKYVPLLYVVSAYFCCFLFANAENVLLIFAGEKFKDSLIPLQIMLLYPLASTYSNLNGSVVYAKSGNTLFRNIAFVLYPFGMAGSFFLISSNFMNLGAVGLAIKVLTLELISVSIVMRYIAKHLKIRLFKYFLHMIFVPITLILIGVALQQGLDYFLHDNLLPIFVFLASGVCYTVVFVLILNFFPIFIGLQKDQIQNFKEKIKSRLSLTGKKSE